MKTIIIEKGLEVQPKQYSEQRDIEKVIIRDGAIIGDGAFYKCTGITHLNIARRVIIGQFSFNGCTGITKLSIAEGVTIGYGASPQSMVRALLTDNNEEKGKHGGFTAYHVGENWPNVAENYADMDQREFRRSITAHPSSVIGEICNRLDIPEHFH